MNLFLWTSEYTLILMRKTEQETGREKTCSETFLYFDNNY